MLYRIVLGEITSVRKLDAMIRIEKKSVAAKSELTSMTMFFITLLLALFEGPVLNGKIRVNCEQLKRPGGGGMVHVWPITMFSTN